MSLTKGNDVINVVGLTTGRRSMAGSSLRKSAAAAKQDTTRLDAQKAGGDTEILSEASHSVKCMWRQLLFLCAHKCLYVGLTV